MFKVLFVYLSFVSCLFAGGLPEVTEANEKEVIAASHTVFEAIFVEESRSYLVDGKEISEEDLEEKLSSLEPIESSAVTVRLKIKLLVTESIKGGLKDYQILDFTIDDGLDSECPHLLNYGVYREKQVYYNSGKLGDHDYRYKTVRETVNFSSVIKNKRLTGTLGKRIGKEIELEGIQPKKVENDPFSSSDNGFQISRLDGATFSGSVSLELDAGYAKAGGELPKVGKKVFVSGYESIIVNSFYDEKELDSLEKEYPQFYGQGIFSIVFIVTDVSEFP